MEIIEHIHIHVLQDQADTMNLTTSEIRKCICKTKQPQKHYAYTGPDNLRANKLILFVTSRGYRE